MSRTGKTILIIITALTLAFIWGNSLMPKNISSHESGFVMRIVTPFLELFTGPGKVTEHLVRKLAHFTEFAILGVELGLLFGKLKRRPAEMVWRYFPITLLHSIAIAVIDETIQIFSGRGPAVSDIWIDTAGSVLGASVVFLIIYACNKIKTA